MSANDGGPAFPAPSFVVPRDLHEAGCRKIGEAMGMTLRDYFAAKAMQGLIASTNNTDRIEGLIGFKRISAAAYCCADAMLKEREK